MTGLVKFYDNIRGFGYIRPRNLDKDVFVLHSALGGPIQKNDRVRFNLRSIANGLMAVDVVVLPALTGTEYDDWFN